MFNYSHSAVAHIRKNVSIHHSACSTIRIRTMPEDLLLNNEKLYFVSRKGRLISKIYFISDKLLISRSKCSDVRPCPRCLRFGISTTCTIEDSIQSYTTTESYGKDDSTSGGKEDLYGGCDLQDSGLIYGEVLARMHVLHSFTRFICSLPSFFSIPSRLHVVQIPLTVCSNRHSHLISLHFLKTFSFSYSFLMD